MQIEAFEQLVRAPPHRGTAQTVVAGLIDEHVADRKIPIEIVLLRREPDETPRGTPFAHDVVTEDLDRARRQRREAHDGVDRGRLARTVRPEKSEEVAIRHVERYAVDRDEIAVPLHEIRDA
jgi:hypothetical protein